MEITATKLSVLGLICMMSLLACNNKITDEDIGKKIDPAVENSGTQVGKDKRQMEDTGDKARIKDKVIANDAKSRFRDTTSFLNESSIKNHDINAIS